MGFFTVHYVNDLFYFYFSVDSFDYYFLQEKGGNTFFMITKRTWVFLSKINFIQLQYLFINVKHYLMTTFVLLVLLTKLQLLFFGLEIKYFQIYSFFLSRNQIYNYYNYNMIVLSLRQGFMRFLFCGTFLGISRKYATVSQSLSTAYDQIG